MPGVSAEAFQDWGRVRCPEDHSNLVPRPHVRTAWCKGCRETYSFDDLVDSKQEAVSEK